MTRAIHIIAAILGMLPALAAPAQQPDAGGEDFTGNTPTPPALPNRAVQPGKGANEVTLDVKSFGIGGAARPGEWVGVWVEVNDSADKVRNVMVRVGQDDADGDTALMQRVIVTNPGATQRVWLYLRFPFAAQSGFNLDITASEAIESGTPASGESQQFVPGRLLGRQRYTGGGRNALPPWVGMLPVVGGHGAGLEQYRLLADSTSQSYAITGHELTEVITGLPMSALPDRWQGYSGATALAWTSQAAEDNPLNMPKGQSDAIREWVRRGGHFVIVLPPVGQNWVGQPGNLLSDILPAAKITRTESVDLEKYRTLLTSDPEPVLPKEAVVQSFAPAVGDFWSSDTFPIMVGPDGETVVLRRLVGEGMVTVVGLDVTSLKLQRITHGFMADQFWNRILGKRLRTLTQAEIDAGNKMRPPPGASPDAEVQSYTHSVRPREVDTGIARAVNDEGHAAVGLMMAFFVFVAYWLIAGPIGYFLLKQRNRKQHAWVAFVAATGIFTAIAWGGANLLKPLRVYGKHLTILDGVYGQNTQRARSWIGMFLPSYGKQEVSVAPLPGSAPPGVGAEWHNLIATLDTPSAGGSSSWSSFPDARGYVVDARKPDTAAFPSRATTKQIQVDWAGSLPEGWGMPHPVADANVPVGQEIKLAKVKDKDGHDTWELQGALVHTLPGALTNVYFTLVREPRNDPSPRLLRYPGEFTRMEFSMVKIAEWQPNDGLKLEALFDPKNTREPTTETFVETMNTFNTGLIDQEIPASQFSFGISFLDMIRPPSFIGRNNGNTARYVYRRQTTHGFDLSRWFTQPCLIVIGELGTDSADGDKGSECPVPIRVSGDDVRKRLKGRTIVRWVYPLEASPFRVPAPETAEKEPGAEGTPKAAGAGGGGGTAGDGAGGASGGGSGGGGGDTP